MSMKDRDDRPAGDCWPESGGARDCWPEPPERPERPLPGGAGGLAGLLGKVVAGWTSGPGGRRIRSGS